MYKLMDEKKELVLVKVRLIMCYKIYKVYTVALWWVYFEQRSRTYSGRRRVRWRYAAKDRRRRRCNGPSRRRPGWSSWTPPCRAPWPAVSPSGLAGPTPWPTTTRPAGAAGPAAARRRAAAAGRWRSAAVGHPRRRSADVPAGPRRTRGWPAWPWAALTEIPRPRRGMQKCSPRRWSSTDLYPLRKRKTSFQNVRLQRNTSGQMVDNKKSKIRFMRQWHTALWSKSEHKQIDTV